MCDFPHVTRVTMTMTNAYLSIWIENERIKKKGKLELRMEEAWIERL